MAPDHKGEREPVLVLEEAGALLVALRHMLTDESPSAECAKAAWMLASMAEDRVERVIANGLSELG